MTTISVGGERAETESGVMEDANVRRYSWQFCGYRSVPLAVRKREKWGVHTPQKKWRINIIKTRRGPFSLSAYKLLKVYSFLSLSSTGRLAALSKSALVGGFWFTMISPFNSGEGSLTAILFREEEGCLPIESIQRTRGTRVRVRSIATRVGSEGNKEEGKTKDRNVEEGEEEEEEGRGKGHGGVNPPEGDLSILESSTQVSLEIRLFD